MAALDLSAVVIPGVVRQETLGNATEPRKVILPTAMAGVNGGGLTISVYPVDTAAYWISPDVDPYPADTTPIFDPISETEMGYLPADQWTPIPWLVGANADGVTAHGDPPSIDIVSRDGSQVVYIAIHPARVPS